MLKFCACAFIFVAVVSASYDFNDSDFNQLLFEDLRGDFDDSLGEPLRLRRDTDADGLRNGCHHGVKRKDRDFHCCRRERIDVSQMEALWEVKKQCIIEVRGGTDFEFTFDPFNCVQMQLLKDQLICIAECVARRLNVLDEQGQLNRDALLTELRLKIGDIKWKVEAVEIFVDKCLAETEPPKEMKEIKQEKDIKPPMPIPEPKKCNLRPLQFAHCIWKAFFLGCPKELQIDSGKCKKMRERLNKGDTSYLHKIFLHHLHSQDNDKKDTTFS